MRWLTAAIQTRMRHGFTERVMTLSAGMIGGQGILVLLTPLLTRIYTPQEFGVFAIVGGIVSVFSTIAALRFEYAIPISRDTAGARDVCLVALASTLLTTILFAAAVWLLGPTFAETLNVSHIAPFLWFVPLALFAWGVSNTLGFWALHQGKFRIKGINLVLQYGSQGASQLAIGFLGFTGIGLVIGLIIGHLVRLGHFLANLSSEDWRTFLHIPRGAAIFEAFCVNWRYPVFVGSAALFEVAINIIPVLLITALYGPVVAGLFGLTQRVVGLPTRLIAEAASQAFVYQGREYADTDFHRFFKKTSLIFLLLAILFLSPILLLGPQLFGFVFGKEWQEAGVIAQLLIPITAARFMVVPISQSLNIIGRQEYHIIWTSTLVVVLIASFGIGWMFDLQASSTIGLYSVLSALCYTLYFSSAWFLTKNRPVSGLSNDAYS